MAVRSNPLLCLMFLLMLATFSGIQAFDLKVQFDGKEYTIKDLKKDDTIQTVKDRLLQLLKAKFKATFEKLTNSEFAHQYWLKHTNESISKICLDEEALDKLSIDGTSHKDILVIEQSSEYYRNHSARVPSTTRRSHSPQPSPRWKYHAPETVSGATTSRSQPATARSDQSTDRPRSAKPTINPALLASPPNSSVSLKGPSSTTSTASGFTDISSVGKDRTPRSTLTSPGSTVATLNFDYVDKSTPTQSPMAPPRVAPTGITRLSLVGLSAVENVVSDAVVAKPADVDIGAGDKKTVDDNEDAHPFTVVINPPVDKPVEKTVWLSRSDLSLPSELLKQVRHILSSRPSWDELEDARQAKIELRVSLTQRFWALFNASSLLYEVHMKREQDPLDVEDEGSYKLLIERTKRELQLFEGALQQNPTVAKEMLSIFRDRVWPDFYVATMASIQQAAQNKGAVNAQLLAHQIAFFTRYKKFLGPDRTRSFLLLKLLPLLPDDGKRYGLHPELCIPRTWCSNTPPPAIAGCGNVKVYLGTTEDASTADPRFMSTYVPTDNRYDVGPVPTHISSGVAFTGLAVLTAAGIGAAVYAAKKTQPLTTKTLEHDIRALQLFNELEAQYKSQAITLSEPNFCQRARERILGKYSPHDRERVLYVLKKSGFLFS